MDRDKLLGTAKLAKGNWRLALDAFGHLGIAFGSALLVTAAPAYFGALSLAVCGGIGTAAGFAAMLLREGIQWAVSGSPHILDRLLDLAPSPIGGLAGGITCWWLVSRYLL